MVLPGTERSLWPTPWIFSESTMKDLRWMPPTVTDKAGYSPLDPKLGYLREHHELLQYRPAAQRLPAEIGHVIWRADKTPCSSVYLPWYFGITSTPGEFRTGTFRPSDASAWWIYQRIANTTDAHYGSFIGKVRTPFSKIEKELLEAQPAMESSALELYKKTPNSAALS